MAKYRASCSSPRAPADVFDYLAHFANAAEWDPGVERAEALSPGAPALGSTYSLIVRFLGLRSKLDYRIIELERPSLARLGAENAAIRSEDLIEVVPAARGGSTVTYTASLKTRGAAVLFAPLVAVAFHRVGDRAMAGLRSKLAS